MFSFIKRPWTSNPKVIVILGPTSTGKTDLSVEIAKKFNGEIISADSRQVYKELNLLSGKVIEEEKQNVPHHLLDAVSVVQDFSVADFQKQANEHVSDILSRNKLPILVGGTGFYIDSVIYNTNLPEVPPNQELRKKLRKLSTQELFVRLQKLDPERAEIIDKHNPVRLVRAIEIAKSLGKNPPPPTYTNPQYKTLFIGLDLPDETLKERINLRIKKRLDQGMLVEAQKLLTTGISEEKIQSLGLDAEYSVRLAQGKIDMDAMITELSCATWQYAKRQRTWFKRNKQIKWFNPLTDSKDILKAVENFV